MYIIYLVYTVCIYIYVYIYDGLEGYTYIDVGILYKLYIEVLYMANIGI
jgi:hypothetical protein